ncbi:hypothetical protein GGF46_000702 [Coemansia sp. RSA 552]|nr:hypothetical protein GGF46_000702 [Coemansia sp. RSA 552]
MRRGPDEAKSHKDGPADKAPEKADEPAPKDAPEPASAGQSAGDDAGPAKGSSEKVVVHGNHGHGGCHDHSHSHHPGQVIQYKEVPPQFGLATHVDDIIHTEFRHVSGFRPFQFHAPGSCLEPLGGEEMASK